MKGWIKFVPGKEYIGLRARFRKVVDGNIEEVEGTIVNDPGAHPWHHNVAISRESDGERLPFPNGLPSYYLRGGEKHYISEPFEVAYYYQPINELDKRAEEYMRSVMRNDGDVFTRSDLYEYITEAWKAGYAEGATTVNYIQCRDCPKRVYYGLAPNMRFSDGENLIFLPSISRAEAINIMAAAFNDTEEIIERVVKAAPRILAAHLRQKRQNER